MKCYWINLDKDIERCNRMVEQLKINNIENVRISGVENEKGYVGCCLSHIQMILTAYKETKDTNENIIFMEDDVNIINGIDHINQYLNYLPNDWDILQCHYIEPTMLMQIIDRHNQNKPMYNKILKGYFMSTACYVMNKRGMEKFLEKMTIVNFSHPNCKAEEMLYRYINSYTLAIPLINTYENYSSNLSKEKEYMERNYTNMCMINELYTRINIKNINISKEICILPYDLHFIGFNKNSLIENFVNRIYEEQKEYLVFLHSGLGSRLFQYCFVYSLARKYNVNFDIFYSSFNNTNYLEFFKIKNGEEYPKIPTNKLLDIIIDPRQSFYVYQGIPISNILYVKENEELEMQDYSCDKNKTYIFNGEFTNEKHFYEYREDILKLFSEPPCITSTLNKLGNVYDNIVAIHVRLGDFVGSKKYFIDLNTYYKYAILVAQRKIYNATFVIVSDEVNINKIYRKYPELKGIPKLITENVDEFVDLYFMTRCRGVICSNSKFSWWGAWLNQKQEKFVTIPDKFRNDIEDTIDMKGALIISTLK